MAELARGNVADRPWGRTLAALGLRGVSGQLTLISDQKRYQVAFGQGAVIGAGSPLTSDAAVRIAMTGHLVSSTQVADIARRQAAAPERDEIEVITELARLTPDQAMRLRRRVVAQRAARTLGIERGEFIVEDAYSVPIVAGSELDIRAVIYLGARQFLSEARLNSELGKLGAWFQLTPEALEDLPQFGFTEEESAALELLRAGAGLRELETPGQEQRMVRAVVYALVSCGACVVESTARPPVRAKPAPPAARPTPRPPAASNLPPPPMVDGTDAPTIRRAPGIDPETVLRPRAASVSPLRKGADAGQARDIEALIQARTALLDGGADHFQLLGVTPEATPEEIRGAYFALARQLHPDRLTALGLADATRTAQRLFAEVNNAFAVLADDARRAAYVDIQRRGGEKAIRAEQAAAEQIALRVLESEEAFRRGELALRRDQMAAAIRELERALELNPDEPDYHAALAWARFCTAPDKMAASANTRLALERAVAAAPKAAGPRFYLGRFERMLGKDPEALRHFQEVLRMEPGHGEAMSEVRVLEARLASGPDKGMFGRPKR